MAFKIREHQKHIDTLSSVHGLLLYFFVACDRGTLQYTYLLLIHHIIPFAIFFFFLCYLCYEDVLQVGGTISNEKKSLSKNDSRESIAAAARR